MVFLCGSPWGLGGVFYYMLLSCSLFVVDFLGKSVLYCKSVGMFQSEAPFFENI